MSHIHTIISGRIAIAAGVFSLVVPVIALAETPAVSTMPSLPPPPHGALIEERKALFEANSAERADLREKNAAAHAELRTDARANIEAVRAASGTPADMRTAVKENQAARRELNESERAARAELLKENATEREAFRAQVKATIATEREALKEKLEMRRAQMAERKEETKAALTAQVQSRIENIIGTVIDRLTAVVDRLEQIAGRIETRQAALATEGIDMGATMQALADAKTAITQARADIATAANISAEVTASDAPQDRMLEMREAVTVVKKDIQAVHDALRDAVSSLNAGVSAHTSTNVEGVGVSADANTSVKTDN